MPSSPSPRLRAELQALGENLNTWGDGRLNAALTRLEEAIADIVPIAITGTSYVLTSTNYVADEARGAALLVTGTLTGNTTITAPTVEKLYLIDNRTTQGGYSLTIKTAAGSGYALRPGPQKVFCDGSDFARGEPRLDQVPLPTAAVDMNTQRLTNLPTPTANGDAATKKYVDDTAFSAAAGNLPAQSGNAGRLLTTNGSVASWGALAADLKDTFWGGTAGGTANALTATTVASLSSLTAGQIVDMKIGASANTGAATLNVDSVGAKAIQKNGAALAAGDLPANTTVSFMYDGTAFQLVGGAGGEDTATSIAAASTVNIGGTSARAITVTAGTGPITAWGTAAAGAHRDITFATTVTLTYNATSAILTGGTNIVAVSGDTCRMESLGSGNWKMLSYQRASGRPLGGVSSQALSNTDKASGITISNSGLTATGTNSSTLSGRASTAMTYPVYWEVNIDSIVTNVQVGCAASATTLTDYLSNSAVGYAYNTNGTKGNNASLSSFGSSYAAGDRLCFAYNPTTNKIWSGKIVAGAAVWGGSGDPVSDTNPMYTTSGTQYPAYTVVGNGTALTFAFASSQLVAVPPAGFSAFS